MVDNGPQEKLSNPIVPMCMVRLQKYVNYHLQNTTEKEILWSGYMQRKTVYSQNMVLSVVIHFTRRYWLDHQNTKKT